MALSYDIIQRGEINNHAERYFHPEHTSIHVANEKQSDNMLEEPTTVEQLDSILPSPKPVRSPPKRSTSAGPLSRRNNTSRFPENTLNIPVSGPNSPVLHYDEYPELTERKNLVRNQNKTPMKPILPHGSTSRTPINPTLERGRSRVRNSVESIRTPSTSHNKQKAPSTSSASKPRSHSAPHSAVPKSYAEKTLVDILKFRHTKEGSYVKELLSPTSVVKNNEVKHSPPTQYIEKERYVSNNQNRREEFHSGFPFPYPFSRFYVILGNKENVQANRSPPDPNNTSVNSMAPRR